MKRTTFIGFVGSLLFHVLLFGLIFLVIIHERGSHGFDAPYVDTHISMQMIKGMVKEEPQPLPEPTPSPKVEQVKKEDVADPTVKPEPVKKEVEKPLKEEKQQAKPKEKARKPVKEKRPAKQKVKNLEKGDKTVLSDAKINSQATSNGLAKGTDPRLAGNGPQTDAAAAYLSSLRREIERQKHYPQRAKLMRKQGVVILEFNLTASGEVTNVRVMKSSGVGDLDRAAVRAAQKARPIGLRPQGVGAQIRVPIEFKIR